MVRIAISTFVALAALASFAAPSRSQAPAQSGAVFEHGPPGDASFFPLAVWLQEPSNAARYKELGINLYVGLWKGPTQAQLDALERAGMSTICDQNQIGLANAKRKVIVGWMHGDEPDNAQPLEGDRGYGPPIAPEQIVADYERMRAADTTRPVLLNLGQGVAWDHWYGRGVRTNHPEDYARYLGGCDIASFDIYPVVHEKPEVTGKLEYVANGVKRLIDWSRGEKPVWACIETTHIGNARVRPTAAQVRSEVWLALVHGATGIVYFAHEFQPKFIEAGLLAYPDIAEGVKAINAEVARLAPVLHAPTVPAGATVASAPVEAPIALLCKRLAGSTYVFAVATSGATAKAVFNVAGLKGSATVQVLDESRTLPAVDGRFEDAFEGYAAHNYRID
jgi:hypothetical protein